MITLGLAGAAGSGKDTVADYLVDRYGFVKVSWADALRAEVAAAFGLPDTSLFLGRATKDKPNDFLSLQFCKDNDFFGLFAQEKPLAVISPTEPLSPRQILLWWGTEYRRAQNENYWVDAALKRIAAIHKSMPYPEHRPQAFVIPDTRFENEQHALHAIEGNVWHIRRDKGTIAVDHVSAQVLPVLEGERELYNNDTISRLHEGIELLLSTQARFVKVEPMLPTGPHVGVGEQGVE